MLDSVIYVIEKKCDEQTIEQPLKSLDDFIEVDYFLVLQKNPLNLLRSLELAFIQGGDK